MSKLQQLKQAIKNPPPERIAKVAYQSHFLNIIGVLFVCAILVSKGFWYIIFAFIFSLGISWSSGMSELMKYRTIMEFKEDKIDIDKEISPTRKRTRIIESIFGKFAWWISIVASIMICYIYIGYSVWYAKLAFGMFAILFHIIIYYFGLYSMANWIYKGRKQ